jgi:hypothetical protein
MDPETGVHFVFKVILWNGAEEKVVFCSFPWFGVRLFVGEEKQTVWDGKEERSIFGWGAIRGQDVGWIWDTDFDGGVDGWIGIL